MGGKGGDIILETCKKVLGEEYTVVCEYLGKDLEYLEYEQLKDFDTFAVRIYINVHKNI